MKFDTLKLIKVFLLITFVLGQISPACAFVSGKTRLIEICSADGNLKTIELSSDAYDPLKKTDQKKQEGMKKECAFCFAQAHIGKIPVNQISVKVVIPQSYRISSSGMIVPKTLKLYQSQPRAPPVIS